VKIKLSLAAFTAISALSSSVYAGDDSSLFKYANGDVEASMYGLVDAAFINVNHSLGLNNALPNQAYPFAGASNTATSKTALVNGGLSDSRMGIKGAYRLTDDVKAIFNVESGFDITNMQINNAAKTLARNSGTGANSTVNADSSLNGGLFDRAAWVGMASKSYGSLTAGTQNSPVKDAIGEYDPAPSDTFSPFGESGTVGGGMGSSEASRMHNSVKYATNSINGFTASIAYQFGNDIATNYGNQYAAKIAYNSGSFGVTAAYSKAKDAVVAGNGTVLDTISLSLYDVEGYLIAAKYKPMTDLTIKAGYEHFTRKDPTDAIANPGSLWGIQVTKLNYGFSGATLNGGKSQDFDVPFIGGDYNFTSKLNLALGYYNESIGNLTNTAGKSGDIKVYTSILKYAYNSNLDLYAAATINNFSGDAYPATSKATNINAYAVGARVKF